MLWNIFFSLQVRSLYLWNNYRASVCITSVALFTLSRETLFSLCVFALENFIFLISFYKAKDKDDYHPYYNTSRDLSASAGRLNCTGHLIVFIVNLFNLSHTYIEDLKRNLDKSQKDFVLLKQQQNESLGSEFIDWDIPNC